MRIEEPATYRERYAAKAGAVIRSPGSARPGWDAILEAGEEMLWQGWSRPKLTIGRGGLAEILSGIVIAALGGTMIGVGWTYGAWLMMVPGVPILLLGLWRLVPAAVWDHLRLRRSFYSLSNRRAFLGGTSLLGRRRLVSWPITRKTSFRLVKGDPPSVRFYEGRLESGRRPRYHAAFESIEDAPEVYKLLKTIQKDLA